MTKHFHNMPPVTTVKFTLLFFRFVPIPFRYGIAPFEKLIVLHTSTLPTGNLRIRPQLFGAGLFRDSFLSRCETAPTALTTEDTSLSLTFV